MGLQHLENDKAMKNYFGPQSGVGDKQVYLAEKPFVTIQGEGPNIGKNTLFVRFYGCNLANSCGKDWCDSTHSFYTNEELKQSVLPPKPDRLTFKDVEQMCETIFENDGIAKFNNVVFTGGEPMLWQMTIARILLYFRDKYKNNITVEIETNGTVPVETELIEWFHMVHFNISPKVHVAKQFPLLTQLNDGRNTDGNFATFDHGDWCLKFVYEGEESKQLIQDCATKYNIPNNKIYLMPEGITREVQVSKMKDCAEYCVNNGYNFSARLHVLIWDEARGV